MRSAPATRRAPPGPRAGRGCRGSGRRSAPPGRARSSSRSGTSTSSSSSSRPPSARIRRSSSRRPRARSGSSPTTARPRRSRSRATTTPFTRTLELQLDGSRYIIVGSRGGTPEAVAPDSSAQLVSSGVGGARLENVAPAVGIDFQQNAFRTKATMDVTAMMGGGVCWVDIDGDGWLDLFAVNSYADDDLGYWLAARRHAPQRPLPQRQGDGSPTSAARRGPTSSSAATAASRATSTATAPPTSTSPPRATMPCSGTTARATSAREPAPPASPPGAGTPAPPSRDVNGDGRPDIFVSGYADVNAPGPADAGFPNNYTGVRDLLYLNTGNDAKGHARFREVGEKARIDSGTPEHGLGAVFMDVNGDGRPDLYVANDANPNRLYMNVPFQGGAAADPLGLGFRLEESAASVGLADPNAGMGIAAADYSGDGRPDIVVTNSHKQLHGVFRSDPPSGGSACLLGRAGRYRVGLRHEPRRLGRLLGRPRQRHEPRSGDRERRHPGARPRAERGAGAGLREPDRPRSSGRVRRGDRRSSGSGRCPRSTVAGSRPPTSTTTAASTSPSTRSAAS